MRVLRYFALQAVFLLSLVSFAAIEQVARADVDNPYIKFAKFGGRMLKPTQPWPTVTLADQNGGVFNREGMRNQWTIAFFGYTSCADVCPMTLSVLNSTLKKWNATEKDPLKVVLISVDPRRDTPAVLKEYTEFFNPAFGAATGTVKQLDTLSAALGVHYEFHDRENRKLLLDHSKLPPDYTVSHTAELFIVAPNGELFARLMHVSDAEMVAEALRVLKTEYEKRSADNNVVQVSDATRR